MKKRLALALAICLLLTGCSGWMDGEYHSVRLHLEETGTPAVDFLQAKSYDDLRQALVEMVENDLENGTISVDGYPQGQLDKDMATAIRYVTASTPIGSYCVESVTYETGLSGGVPAVAVTIGYNSNRTAVRRMRRVKTMEEAQKLICAALDQCEEKTVMQVEQYVSTDFSQMVRTYAENHPESVMELPEVIANLYPAVGQNRILEIRLSYQNSREDLRSMQSQVQPLFTSARLYISGPDPWERYSQLYSFLAGRLDSFRMETSLTPSYSLLIHGVGDSRALATVYAAMCRQSNLTCYLVSGTRDGESWYWNIIGDGETYRHIDLVEAVNTGVFQLYDDERMTGYVWDYSAYPPCLPEEEPTEPVTEPTQEPTDSTEPSGPPETTPDETNAPTVPPPPPESEPPETTEPTVPPTDSPTEPEERSQEPEE